MTDCDRISFFHNECGVSVIFGTLMLILITIIAASGIAVMASTVQKETMERESHRMAVENENLRIIAIDPVGNSTHWNSINVTILNLNTADSYITGISMNNIFAKNYNANDESGALDHYKGYLVIYNFKKRVLIPATRSKVISLNLTGITVNSTEVFDVSGWVNGSKDYTYSLPNHPVVVYPEVLYPDVEYIETVKNSSHSFTNGTDYTMDHQAGNITLLASGNMNIHLAEIVNVTGWDNNSVNFTYHLPHHPINVGSESMSNSTISHFIQANNYTMNYTAGNITLIGTDFGGNMSNSTGNYNITYTTDNTIYNITYMTDFKTFTSPLSIRKEDSITLEVITSLINIFEQTFIPAVPLAEVQFETERLVDSNGSISYRDYLILDASRSFDPDGYITAYRWAVWNNSTELIYDYNLTGVMARPTKLNLTEATNVKIDLEVHDDTGMVSRLSQRGGNITIA